MKRRLSHLFLAFVLMATLSCGTLAHAQSTTDFTRQRSYAGQFTDVASNAWYAPHVATLYEYGLTTGTSATTYSPNTPVPLCDVATFAARILSQYQYGTTNSFPQATGADWYSGYVSFLKAESIIGTEFDGRWTQSATRGEVAHLLANLLPVETLPLTYDEPITQAYALKEYIPDVDDNTPWQADIIRLYKLGLVNGSDAQGSYQPQRTITRAELAAILTRILDPSLRVTLDFTPIPVSKLCSYGALVTAPAQQPTAPRTSEEYDAVLRWMLANESNTLVLQYEKDELNSETVSHLLYELTEGVTRYCEQMYNYASCQYTPATGRVCITFSAMAMSDASFSAYRTASLQMANQVHDTLWSTGELDASMSESQKAAVYLRWLCANCSYDYGASDKSLSHTAYSALVKGVAVCDGYVGAYHLLLATEGIACRAVSDETHIWTQTTLDGQLCYIDPTWVDGGSVLRWQFFAMDEAESIAVHG